MKCRMSRVASDGRHLLRNSNVDQNIVCMYKRMYVWGLRPIRGPLQMYLANDERGGRQAPLTAIRRPAPADCSIPRPTGGVLVIYTIRIKIFTRSRMIWNCQLSNALKCYMSYIRSRNAKCPIQGLHLDASPGNVIMIGGTRSSFHPLPFAV